MNYDFDSAHLCFFSMDLIIIIVSNLVRGPVFDESIFYQIQNLYFNDEFRDILNG